MADKTTAVAAQPAAGPIVPDSDRYLANVSQDFLIALKDNMGGGGADKLDLPRLKVPAGGGLAWTVPTTDGPKPREHIDGIIIAFGTVRAYWKTALGDGGGNAPPDCSSADGSIGIGDPGGDCDLCPLNAFNTADGGNKAGKACREARGLLILQQGDYLPFYLPAPTMSIKPLKDYFMRLTQQAKPYHAVVTRFSLIQAQNKDRVTYSAIEPTRVRDLDDTERAALSSYRDVILPAFMAQPKLTRSDFSGESA